MVTAPAPRPDPIARPPEGYWAESRRPLAGLVFVAPFLATYELGALLLGVQNGADMWMRSLLDLLGFGQHFLLPFLTVGILLGWHYTTRQPWRLSAKLFYGMAAECALLAVCLRLLLQFQGSLFQAVVFPTALSVSAKLKDAVGFLGAGIYEELLFRLILLSATAWGLGRLGMGRWPRMAIAVLATSLMFSAAHYIGPYGDQFHWFSFLFRFLAGAFFSILFVYRGFGIAAGTHAGYNMLVGLFSV